jgi:hypothetical protein
MKQIIVLVLLLSGFTSIAQNVTIDWKADIDISKIGTKRQIENFRQYSAPVDSPGPVGTNIIT